MKSIQIIYLLLITVSQGFTQNNSIEIIDSADYKINFRFVDSSHAIFVLEEFEDMRTRLVNYSIVGDTILLSDNDDKLSISTSIFYDHNDTLAESLIMFQSIYLHQYEGGHGLPEEVVFKTPCRNTFPIDSTDYKSTSIISYCTHKFPLIVQTKYGKDVELQIDLPENTNHVMIKFVDLFTIEFPHWLLTPIFPLERSVNGRKYIFKWEKN